MTGGTACGAYFGDDRTVDAVLIHARSNGHQRAQGPGQSEPTGLPAPGGGSYELDGIATLDLRDNRILHEI
ncbi:MAG: hypothetical protein WCB04_12865 [Mycobacteriales bacterium]